jgi:hypothetical protein
MTHAVSSHFPSAPASEAANTRTLGAVLLATLVSMLTIVGEQQAID